MRRTYHFAESTDRVTCELGPGRSVQVQVIPGILKHPRLDQLPALLVRPHVARKYAATALSKASWPVLRQFPRQWLRECLELAPMKPTRREALAFLLSS